jgi:hypothetical protein
VYDFRCVVRANYPPEVNPPSAERFKIQGSKFKGHGSRFKGQDSKCKGQETKLKTQNYAFYECGKGAGIIHCLSQTGARTGAPSAHKYRRHPSHHRSCIDFDFCGKRDCGLDRRF